MMVAVELIGGFVLLILGGEILVRGAVAVAARMGLSPMLIGLTLIGFGTSLPELMASLEAARRGAPGIAVGNVVGSNIANILLILGVSSLIFPMVTKRESLRRDGPALLVVSLAMAAAVLWGVLTREIGIAFVVILLCYLVFSYIMDKRGGGELHAAEATEIMPKRPHLGIGLAMSVGGIAGVLLGAEFLVSGAIEIARIAGLSEAVIGLTLVAIGTSLPELVTSAMAAIRRHSDVALGNVIGSNIFNMLGIAGITAMVSPIQVPPEVIRFDIWAMLAATVLMLAFVYTWQKLSRWQGGVFLACYGAYMAVQFVPELRALLGLA